MKKKKILATIFALVLCLGIATHTLAVGNYIDEWDKMPLQKTSSYQVKPTKAIQHYMLYWNWDSHDYIYNGGGMDGNFGNATKNAVKAFQSSRGITIDGIVGPATWRTMYSNLTYDRDTGTAYVYTLSAIEQDHDTLKRATSVASWYNMAGNQIFYTYIPT